MKQIIQYLLFVFIMTFAINSKAIPTFFDQDSFQQIVNKKKDKSFMLLLWSLDCTKCIEDFSVVSNFHKDNPEVEIVLVSTDEIIRLNEISALITKHNLNDLEQWIFQSNKFQQLRHSIDPQWHGELPRSYFYSSGKQTGVFSGRIHKSELDKWLMNQSKTISRVKVQ